MKATLQANLRAQLESAPSRRALAFVDAQGDFSWMSFEEVYRNASVYAASFSAQGLGPGDVCLLVLPSRRFCALALLGVLLVNAVPLLMAPPTLQGKNPYLLQVLKRLIRKTRAKLVVAPESMREMQTELQGVRKKTAFVFGEVQAQNGPSFALPAVLPDEGDVAALQLTSGTTGFPRVCVWKQRGVVAALEGMVKAMDLSEQDVCLNWTPLYHDMGLVNNFLLCLTNGIPLAMMDPFDFVKKPALWLQSLSKTGATTTWSPNFGFAITTQWALESQLDGVRLDHVRGFWNAAERIHLETMTAFYRRFARYGVRKEALKTNFGCAENVGGATFSALDGTFVTEWVDAEALYRKRIARIVPRAEKNGKAVAIVGVGRGHPGLRIRILSPKGRLLPDGRVGEIALETPSRMEGYLGQAQESRRAIRGNLLRTGDLGYLRGEELFWVGRVKERIAVRGKKLDPSDFERVLLRIPDLRPGCFVTFGVDNQKAGTQDVVVVSEIRNSGTARPDEEIAEEIRQQISLRLGVPVSDVVLVPKGTLKKTSSGKRRHRYYRELYLKGELEQYRGTNHVKVA